MEKAEGREININFISNSESSQTISLMSTSTAAFEDLSVKSTVDSITLNSGESKSVPILISSNENSLTGRYKVLLGGETDEVTISKYIDVQVEK